MKLGAVWGMYKPLRYDLLEEALLVVTLCRPLIEVIQRKDRDLASWFFNHFSASQVRRAVSSISLNLAEAFGTAAGNARLRFETARGSMYEAQAGIRVAVAWDYLSAEQVQPAVVAIDKLGGRVFGLVRR